MVNKNMRNITYAVFMTLLTLLTIFSTTISSTTIPRNTAITFCDLSQKNEIKINVNEIVFVFIFGFIIIDAIIVEKLSLENTTLYGCYPVEKVIIIGFGDYVTHPDTEANPRFYIKSFTNVSLLYFHSSKIFGVSDEYQHFSLFVTPLSMVGLYFN